MLIWIALGAAIYHIDWSSLSLPKYHEPSLFSGKTTNASPPTPQCDAEFPAHGQVHGLEPSTLWRSDVMYSSLALENQHRFPVVVVIEDADHQHRYEAVTVYAGQKTEVSLPLGEYGLLLMLGNAWCSFDTGFTDGRQALVNQPIEILEGRTHRLQIVAVAADDFAIRLVSTQLEPPPPPVQPMEANAAAINFGNSGNLELHRQGNGGFFVAGAVNRVPVVFQIDTGASVTSIPKEVALSAGIYGCDGRLFETANGKVFGCLSPAREITFGNQRLEGFQIAAMPNLKGALLGMNVLRNYRIENVGDVMRISPLASVASVPQAPALPAYQPAPPVYSPPVYTPQPVAQERPASPSLDEEVERKANLQKFCDQPYQQQKDAINARMRQAYNSQEGENFREVLRQNEKTHRECLQAIR